MGSGALIPKLDFAIIVYPVDADALVIQADSLFSALKAMEGCTPHPQT